MSTMSEIPPPLDLKSDDRIMALLAHLSWLASLAIIVPIILLVVKTDSPFVQDQSKEALNFQLSVLIVTFVTCGLGGIVAIPAMIVFSIIAALEAHKGVVYRYPYTIRLVK